MDDRLVNEGLHFSYESRGKQSELVIYPVIVADGGSTELVDLDIEASVEWLLSLKKTGNIFTRGFYALFSRWQKPSVRLLDVKIDEQRLVKTLMDRLASDEHPPQNAGVIVSALNPLQYEMTPAAPGIVYNYNQVIDKIVEVTIGKVWGLFSSGDCLILFKRTK